MWTAPSYPENHKMMYGFNKFSLQLNLLPDQLKDKLPPTDSRFRQDVKIWESGQIDNSTDEKNRIELNQRKRKKLLKELLKDQPMDGDDSVYYTPKYFKMVNHDTLGEGHFEFQDQNSRESNYWLDRDKGKWDHMPKIFDDSCEPFYN